ncbi:winged helix-turn-helix transcriptional regulator [Mobiluncus mulieris]|uniref:winged helix-turn-helix transcriptional regulator n=1 Tax=Mobiluncus mulieris TaxID=2052 RepID=UPI002016A068|nr:winged helix-turn-helix domain-containing protein [Mobiluncus mulieris]
MREPKRYSTILAAITSGASKNNQIATKTGISSGALTNYLEALIDLGIVSRESPWVAPGGHGAMGAGVRFHEVPVQVADAADAADETRFTEFKMAVSGSGTASCGRTSPLLRCMPDVPPSRQQLPRN